MPRFHTHAEEPDDAPGRDFPKTLTLDEPGVDDELSLPTFTHLSTGAAAGSPAATQNDASVEIDKRVTDTLQVQIVDGYRTLSSAAGAAHAGLDDVTLTAKQVIFDQPRTETIVTLGLSRELACTGATDVGAETIGDTTPTFYFGQGFGAARLPALLRPFAITGTVGYLVPDRLHGPAGAQAAQAIQIGASAQYSLHYLAEWIGRAGLPTAANRLVAISEITYEDPTTNPGATQARHGFLAPGLIYAGDGYQLAVEGLLPLTRGSGRGVGVIAQLNLSFATLGLGGIARPILP